MSGRRNSLNDLRRLIGYLMVSFLAVFLYFPFLWLSNIWGMHADLYVRWAVASVIILAFNTAFYFWRYPEDWQRNLLVLAGVDLFLMACEYLWISG
ncbi:MAG: hypothetical protein ACYCVD_01630 [Desulfitobacteriaceae bacterium]